MLNIALRKRWVFVVFCMGLAGPLAADPPGRWGCPAGPVFRDWRIDCRPDHSIGTEVRAATGGLVLRLRATPDRLRVETPLPLFLPDGVTLGIGEAEARSLVWRICDRRACVAEVPLDPALVAALRAAPEAAVGFTLADGLRVRLSASLLGFTAASEAQARLLSP